MKTLNTPLTANTQTLARVVASDVPKVLVFFRDTLPADVEASMKALAHKQTGKLLIVKLNLADNPELVKDYQIQATPTLIALRGGGEQVARADNGTAALLENYAAYLLGQTDQLLTPEKKSGEGKVGNAKPITLTASSFKQQVLENPLPVLVDFWANWCGPCHMIAPSVEKMAGEFAGRLTVGKLDVDAHQGIAMQYGISGIPALLLFKNGKVADRLVGAAPEPMLRQFIQKHI